MTGSRLRPMSGRDPDEHHRAATPLELLYDLTFVVAFGVAGSELAHALAAGHIARGLLAFGFCVFAICWAWISFTWFASAYDTDDWAFRLLTMVQMAGVIILAMGIPDVFSSVDEGNDLNNTVVVAGYVVMRIPMVGLWLRAARHDPERRSVAMTYVITILISQTLWILLLIPELDVRQILMIVPILYVIELAGPVIAETRFGGTPWHPHHIAERYGLLAIITLGETVIGTVAAMSALLHEPGVGWNTDAAVVLGAGLLLTFGMWWIYFAIPWSDLLVHHRERSFFWGYGHILIFGSIAATGAGLHTVEYYLEHHSELSAAGTILSVVLPVGVYAGMIFLMYSVSLRVTDPFHVILLVATAAVLVLAVILGSAGVSIGICLVVVALAPMVTVIGYETLGHRHMTQHLERLRS